jgi:diguanylate cyclase (GGDEF)-like protein
MVLYGKIPISGPFSEIYQRRESELTMSLIKTIPKFPVLLSIFFTIIPDFLDNYDNFYIDDMSWFALLFPCFICSYYLGLVGGVWAGIIANAYHLFWFFYEKKYHSGTVLDESVALHIGIVIITLSCSIGVGLLSEKLQKGKKQIQALNEKLMNLALYDSLTGLPNRLYFMEKLDRFLKRKQQISMLFIDLDSFKRVNDQYGHDVGDQLLQEVAQKLKNVQDECTFVSRLGGDEFTVILSGAKLEKLNETANRILRLLEVKVHDVLVSGSIGIVLAANGDTPSSLLKRADTAMYKAKSSGKNTICFFNPDSEIN